VDLVDVMRAFVSISLTRRLVTIWSAIAAPKHAKGCHFESVSLSMLSATSTSFRGSSGTLTVAPSLLRNKYLRNDLPERVRHAEWA
jgi:hypothetical protein